MVGRVCSRTKATEFSFFLDVQGTYYIWTTCMKSEAIGEASVLELITGGAHGERRSDCHMKRDIGTKFQANPLWHSANNVILR
jgi:hypothetical protein